VLSFKTATAITQHRSRRASPWVIPPVTVSAAGDGTLSYQWQRNGVNLVADARITGVTSPTLNFTSVLESDLGDYACVVTGGCGTVTSGAAALTLSARRFPGDVAATATWTWRTSASCRPA